MRNGSDLTFQGRLKRILLSYGTLFILCLSPWSRAAAQYVAVTAKIELTFWGASLSDNPPAFQSQSWDFYGVVGTNRWLLQASDRASREVWSYTGSNLVSQVEITRDGNGEPKVFNSAFEFRRDFESGMGPLLPAHFRAAWLALCSGPFLSETNREVPMLSTFWKETWLNLERPHTPFVDESARFDDALGLPMSVQVRSQRGHLLLDYRLKGGPSPLSTNYFGWHFPVNFQVVQYAPVLNSRDQLQVYLMAKGTVTSLKRASELALSVKDGEGKAQIANP